MNYIDDALADLSVLMKNGRNILERLGRTNRGECFVLGYLYKRGKALPTEISAAMNSSTARVSAILGVLEKRGDIIREVDTGNRRKILVTLTGEGKRHMENEMFDTNSRLRKALEGLGEDDAKQFILLLKRFAEIMLSLEG